MENRKVNRWLILVAAVVTNIALGAGYMWSLFYGPLQAELAFSPNISWAYSLSFAMVPIAMIYFGPKVDEMGGKKIVFLAGLLFGGGMILSGLIKKEWMLYITYGLITGFGIGTGYGTATATSTKWFPDKKGLAGGLTAAGFGSGSLVLTPIVQPMIESRGIQSTFIIMGIALGLVIIAASFFMLKAPVAQKTAQTNAATVATNDKNYKEMMKEGNFWLLWVIYTLAATGGMMLIGHAAKIVNDYGFTVVMAAPTVIMTAAVANTAGRVGWGAISDKIGRYITVVLMFAVSAAGLLLLNFNELVGPTLAIVGILLVYLSFGGFLGAFPGITAENWGAKNSAQNYGWMFTAYGIAAIAGPQIATILGYSTAFIVSAIFSVVGLVLMLLFMSKNK